MNRCEYDGRCRSDAEFYVAPAKPTGGKRASACFAHLLAHLEAWASLPDAVRPPLEVGAWTREEVEIADVIRMPARVRS